MRRQERFVRSGMLAVDRRAWGASFDVMLGLDGAPPARPPFTRAGKLAVVRIEGPLVHHADPWWDSYDAIMGRVSEALADRESEAVCLRINSPGGDVDGCFDTARALRALAQKSGKRLLAYADGMAASAAYALACSAERIYLSSTSKVGSIGVIEAICDVTARDAVEGIRFEFIASGVRKADGNPHVPISEAAIANLQDEVDAMAELFFGLVEDLRGLPRATTRGLEARMLFGAGAVQGRLADEVTTWAQLSELGMARDAPSLSAGDRTMAKAGYLKHMLKSVAESEGDDFSKEEKEHAAKMLESLDGGAEKDGEGKEKEPEGEKAEAEPEKKEAKAEGKAEKADPEDGDGEEKKDEKAKAKAEGAKARAATSEAVNMQLAARVHALEAERASEKESAEREKLLAKRPDFSAEIRKTLAKAPLDQLRDAVENWPKIPSRLGQQTAAASATGTRGERQTDEQGGGAALTPDEQRYIDRKMGLSTEGTGIRHEGRSLELGAMTPAQARAHVAKLEAAAAGAAAKK